MRRYFAPVLACFVVLATLAALPVAGHGNHLTADAQVVDDHVVVERSFILQDGYAVVHIDKGGQMGKAIGHAALKAGPDENYEIDVDQEFLSQIDGVAKVWVALHRTDGDGEFEPNQDTALTGIQGRVAGSVIPIYVSEDGNVNVVARDFGSQRIDDASVTVRRAESNRSGFVAVADENGTVLGSAPVSAGANENVSVPLAASFYESMARNESAQLTATVYRDDGDGEFDASADRPVTVGGTPVASEFEVTKVANASRTTSIVVTATGTTAPAPTTTSSGGSTAAGSGGSETGSGEAGGALGFGAVAAGVALVAALAVLGVRQRD
ncbi:hypothetical protein [Halorubellus sp. PRR65]|uniref:DUF7282 domain-containing protein n=1 Tax=Halorubellus sp. PRR65 TaxID=3098148 RepID=UPI002B25663A|nr:hypothetical protein [Halorubellus sp. PRR65]